MRRRLRCGRRRRLIRMLLLLLLLLTMLAKLLKGVERLEVLHVLVRVERPRRHRGIAGVRRPCGGGGRRRLTVGIAPGRRRSVGRIPESRVSLSPSPSPSPGHWRRGIPRVRRVVLGTVHHRYRSMCGVYAAAQIMDRHHLRPGLRPAEDHLCGHARRGSCDPSLALSLTYLRLCCPCLLKLGCTSLKYNHAPPPRCTDMQRVIYFRALEGVGLAERAQCSDNIVLRNC